MGSLRTMKTTLAFGLLCIMAILFNACKDNDGPSPLNNGKNPFNYFPLVDGNEWEYEVTEIDSLKGTFNIVTENSKYIKDSGRVCNFRNGIEWSSMYWKNQGHILGCCGDMVLLDYNFLDCSSDSVKISSKVNTSLSSQTFQFCKKVKATEVKNFMDKEGVRTVMLNEYSNGSKLVLEQIFVLDIGLVYRKETSYDANEKLKTQSIRRLVSFKFP